jgi:hypothetical protein
LKRILITVLTLVVALLMGSATMFAHHGNSAYNEVSPITITGVVTEFVWSNPHCQIYLDVTDDKGNVVHWGIESQSPGILVRAGWTRKSLQEGDHITITLAAAKNGAPVGFSGGATGKVVFADGRILTMTQKSQ